MDDTDISKAAAALGRKGGQARTQAQTEARRRNGLAPCHDGKRRGRPKKIVKKDEKTIDNIGAV